MLPSFRVVVLSLCSTAAAACGFDSNGLATGSNSAGTLESSGGGESSTADASSATITSASGPSTLTSGSDESSSTTPSTTLEPTESSGGATESTGGDGSEASSGDASLGTSSEDAETSSESGVTPDDPYGDCGDSEDCNGGICVPLYLDYVEHSACYPPCESKPECPPPTSGEAQPTCTDSGCGLDCDPDGGGGNPPLSCPDGMSCGYTSKGNRRCLWE